VLVLPNKDGVVELCCVDAPLGDTVSRCMHDQRWLVTYNSDGFAC
jgi:hypothetical protein